MRSARRASFVAVLLLLLSVGGRAAGVPVLGVVLDPALQPLPGAAVELMSVARAGQGPGRCFSASASRQLAGGTSRAPLSRHPYRTQMSAP